MRRSRGPLGLVCVGGAIVCSAANQSIPFLPATIALSTRVRERVIEASPEF